MWSSKLGRSVVQRFLAEHVAIVQQLGSSLERSTRSECPEDLLYPRGPRDPDVQLKKATFTTGLGSHPIR